MKKREGQLLMGAIILVAVLAIILPVLVMYVQNETKWSVKQGQNTNAFQLAEGALERGYQKVIESTQTWAAVQTGQALTGMSLNSSFTDLAGGSYAISVTSGPNLGEVTIIGVGRDKMNKETRALKAVYANSLMSDVSIAAAKGVTMNGNNIEVEWGAISSPRAISILTKSHPSYWSAAGIDKDIDGPGGNNCDSPNCWWWHSYYTALPPMPAISFSDYKSSAIAAGNDPCGHAYYQPGNWSTNCDSLNGKTYYIEGNWTEFKSAIKGNIIVMGNFTFKNGNSQNTGGSYNATVPPEAWKQYCNDWSYYRTNFDPTLPVATPACFGNIDTSYRPSLVKSVNPAIHGFVYVGGDLTLPNGGGSDDLLHGAIVVNGNADINSNSHCKVYYDPDIAAAIITTNVNLVRQSWQDTTTSWPATLP